MKPLLLTLTSLAAVVGMAGPARADSNDDAFLASLHAAGITFPDPAAVIGAGKWVCQAVGKGTQMVDVVKTIQAQNPGLHGDNAGQVHGDRGQRVLPPSGVGRWWEGRRRFLAACDRIFTIAPANAGLTKPVVNISPLRFCD